MRYTELEGAAIITLSLRHFPDGLLVEVFDSDANPPVLVKPTPTPKVAAD